MLSSPERRSGGSRERTGRGVRDGGREGGSAASGQRGENLGDGCTCLAELGRLQLIFKGPVLDQMDLASQFKQ